MDMKTIGIPPCTGTPGQPPVLSRIALEDRSVIDSKAYFVAFQTLMFIIFQEKYSIAFLLFILSTRRSNMIEKERKI